MNEEFLKNIKIAYFVGIGGIGVSAVARLMLARGVVVSGSDRSSSSITKKLEEKGANVFIGQEVPHIPDPCDLVVYSPAISVENPDIVVAKEKGVQTLSYPEALGMISRGMRTIAVAGTHGKTTTTGMIAEVLVGAHKDPTVIVGSLLKSGTNFINGKSDLFVVEACEYKRSFLNLSPEILVITNIDNDHLDYYGSIEGIQNAFTELVGKVPKHGAIICNPNNSFVAPVLSNTSAQIVDYTKEILPEKLAVSGEHNIQNAKAAFAVARLLEVNDADIGHFLAQFEGTWRRMEYKGETNEGTLVYDDYAHHPTEVRAALQGFRAKFPKKKIRVIFQPHLYSRTKLLLNEFAQSFGDANEVIVAPIYAAREKADPEITNKILAQEILKYNPNVQAFDNLEKIIEYIAKSTTSDDVIVTMGAGDVFNIGEALLG